MACFKEKIMNNSRPIDRTYKPAIKSLKKHPLPQWFEDAKFGIFIHWSTSAIPAYAPVGMGSSHEIISRDGWEASFRYTPYAEWYINSILIPGTPAYEYHKNKYGSDYKYDNFIPEFKKEMQKCDPGKWADLFKSVNAKYVVFVTKHMDGFLLWPSSHKNPVKPGYMADRDMVGELTEAVKSRGMRMGFYYSSMLDYTFDDRPIMDVADLITSGSTGKEYTEYVESHWRELIDRYDPDILWGDIAYPPESDLYGLFAYYYNKKGDGLVNDRWIQIPEIARKFIRTKIGRTITNYFATRSVKNGVTEMPNHGHCDYRTPEYSTFSKIMEQKWECVRGIGASFGYNAMEPDDSYASVEELVRMLVDTVSKNGNLLLNVGPMADGTIPDVQIDRIRGIGAWLDINGEAIFGTRPWERAEGETEEGTKLRFTRKENSLYVFLLDKPSGHYAVIPDIGLSDDVKIRLLLDNSTLVWEQYGKGVKIYLPESLPDSPAYALKISPAFVSR